MELIDCFQYKHHLFGPLCQRIYNYVRLKIVKKKKTVENISFSTGICLSFVVINSTVEPRFNEPLFNKVLDITNDILHPSQSYSKIYGIKPQCNEPRYNEFFNTCITNIIRKSKHKIYLDITDYNVNTQRKINTEQINSQQILVILMVKRQQPFSQQPIICHRHWHYSTLTSINF